MFFHELGIDAVASLVSFVGILQAREQELRLALFLRQMAVIKVIGSVYFKMILVQCSFCFTLLASLSIIIPLMKSRSQLADFVEQVAVSLACVDRLQTDLVHLLGLLNRQC